MAKTPLDRFWAKVDKNGPVHPRLGTRCWLWTAARSGGANNDYGYFRYNGKNIYAHRLSYQLAGNEITPGLYVDHICLEGLCVNPRYLRANNPQTELRESSRALQEQ